MTTRGIEYLNKYGITCEVLTYRHEVKGAKYAAHALDLPPEIVIKSLVFQADNGSFMFALMSGDGSVSEKKLARASLHKRVAPASPHDAQRITGYLVGGISPLGAKNPLPVFLDRTVASHPEVVINAGARGTLLRLATTDLVSATQAIIADIRIEQASGKLSSCPLAQDVKILLSALPYTIAEVERCQEALGYS